MMTEAGFALADFTGGLQGIRQELDNLWALARDACAEPEARNLAEHKPSIDDSAFSILQLVSMLEDYVVKMRGQDLLHEGQPVRRLHRFEAAPDSGIFASSVKMVAR